MAKQYWLMKSEPDVYSIEDLERDGSTCWDGVRNYKARNNMQAMHIGDEVLYYHSNAKPPGVVGIARVCREAYPDHTQFDRESKYYDPRSDPDDPRWRMVDIEYVSKVADVDEPLGLPDIKADPKLADMELVRYGRLSVQSVEKADFDRVKKLAGLVLLVLSLITSLVPASLSAQQLANDDAVLRRIWVEGMTNSHIASLGQVLLDEIGPRLTASPGMERAQAWAVETLEGFGVDARLEEYGTWEGWDRGPSHIDLISPRVRSLEGRTLAWSPGTGGRPVEGAVTYLPVIERPADWQSFLQTVRGKWVMLSYPEPTCRTDGQWAEFAMEGSFERVAAERELAEARWNGSLARAGSADPRYRDLHHQLEEAGAAGIITSQWPGSYGTTRVFNAYNRQAPTFELGCEDYGLVYRMAANGEEPMLRLTAQAENLGEVPVFNVVGEIPGTEWPDQYVMLSAHFDSWEGGSGATDNGSGSLLMLETMRILKAVYPNPKRTILIGLWSGEEQGLNGSRAFSEDHPEVVNGLQALWNQDNGTGRIVRLSAQGLVGATPSIAAWMSKVPAEVSQYVELELPGTPGSGGSDYASFVCHGAPAFSLGALSWDYSTHTWHTHRDTYDKLVFDDLRNNAVLTASLVYLSAEDPTFVDRTRRTVMTDRQGAPMQWPSCEPAVRNSKDSPRMQ